MSKQRRFTKEFEAEAVRLAETSGRTRAARSRTVKRPFHRPYVASATGDVLIGRRPRKREQNGCNKLRK